MPSAPLVQVMLKMVTVLQLSILVPMIVVWLRKSEFLPAIKLLSWYVYLSAFCVLGGHYTEYAPNALFIIGFNLSKIALFGAVYYMMLESARMRQLVLITTLMAVAVSIVLTGIELVTHFFDIANYRESDDAIRSAGRFRVGLPRTTAGPRQYRIPFARPHLAVERGPTTVFSRYRHGFQPGLSVGNTV